ncbi:MAG: hypothetical protein JJT78_03625 [Leptospira sp.]|nr:hypothetical protein [Leptospira sp.]
MQSRKGFSFIIISVLFFFLQCAAGNIWLTINPDRSGQLQFIKKEYKDKRTAKLSFIKGGKPQETEFSITSMDMPFQHLDDLEMEGASFIFYHPEPGKPNHYCLLLSLDTSSSSPWFTYFGITNISVTKFQKEMNNRDDLARFNNLTDYMVWEIKMPGRIVSVKDFEPLGPEWWISNHNNSKAVLKIPAKDIINSRRKLSTYEICSLM